MSVTIAGRRVEYRKSQLAGGAESKDSLAVHVKGEGEGGDAFMGWVRYVGPQHWEWHPATGPEGERRWQMPCKTRMEAIAKLFRHWNGPSDPEGRPLATAGLCQLCGAVVVYVRDKQSGRQVACEPRLVVVIDEDGGTVRGRAPHAQSCPGKQPAPQAPKGSVK